MDGGILALSAKKRVTQLVICNVTLKHQRCLHLVFAVEKQKKKNTTEIFNLLTVATVARCAVGRNKYATKNERGGREGRVRGEGE